MVYRESWVGETWRQECKERVREWNCDRNRVVLVTRRYGRVPFALLKGKLGGNAMIIVLS